MVSKSITPLAWLLALAIAAALLAQTPFLGRVALADDDDDDRDRTRASVPLPNGVAAGDVTENSGVLWARSDLPGLLIFNVAEELEFEDDDDTITAIVAVFDALIPGKVEITGLEADEEYYYRAQGPGGAASICRFRTLPESDEDDSVRFGVSGDHRGELGPFVAVRNVVERDLDFFGNLGDTTLLEGSYTAVHYYGWTEFDIGEDDHSLTVTTYGSRPYTEADILSDPAGVLAIQPTVVSQFVVNPK